MNSERNKMRRAEHAEFTFKALNKSTKKEEIIKRYGTSRLSVFLELEKIMLNHEIQFKP